MRCTPSSGGVTEVKLLLTNYKKCNYFFVNKSKLHHKRKRNINNVLQNFFPEEVDSMKIKILFLKKNERDKVK